MTRFVPVIKTLKQQFVALQPRFRVVLLEKGNSVLGPIWKLSGMLESVGNFWYVKE